LFHNKIINLNDDALIDIEPNRNSINIA